MEYDAVILGDEGVLTARTPTAVWRQAARAAFAAFDAEPTTEGVDSVIHGGVGQIRRVCELHGIEPERFWTRHESCAAAAQRAALEEGQKPLYDDVSELFDLDCPLVVVSNNQQRTVDHVVDRYGLDDQFAAWYGREPTLDALSRRKPSPHYIDKALTDLGVDTDDSALFVGDSNADVQAARRAGIDVTVVRRPSRVGYELTGEPTAEVTSLRHLATVV